MKRNRAALSTDVLVVGAGAAGIPAAIGAARAGARVLLIEEDSVIGGAPVDYYVTAFCGLPWTGVILEIAALLKRDYPLLPEAHFYLPESFQRVLWRLLRRERNLTVMPGARAVGVLTAHGTGGRPRVQGVFVERPHAKPLAIRSRITIDATGTGAVALAAGCRAMYGRDAARDFGEPHAPARRDRQVQHCTWMYFSHKLGSGKPFDMMRLDNARCGVSVAGLGWYHNDPAKARRLNRPVHLHWGCAVACRDTRDPLAIAAAQTEALAAMERDHALLRENGYAVYLAPRLGIRETSRIRGEHVITENDLRSGRLPSDTIAVGSYGLDIWGGMDEKVIEATPGYGIPYRALVPQDADGLLLAGMILSGSHVAMSAYRVMPIVGSAGQAAGVAAALCARQGSSPRELDPEQVRRILRGRRQKVQLDFEV